MAISQQKSGLTGRLTMNPLMFKNPSGVLGRRENVSVPAINTPANETNLMEAGRELSPIDVPGLTGLADGGNGPSTGGGMPSMGSQSRGQAAVQNAMASQNASQFGAKALGIGASIVGPSVIGSIAQQSPNLGLASALGYTAAVAKGLISAHPALGIANIGFTAAAKQMAQEDMAKALDENDISLETDESGQMSFSGLSAAKNPKGYNAVAQAATNMSKAQNAPYGFLGSRVVNWGKDTFGFGSKSSGEPDAASLDPGAVESISDSFAENAPADSGYGVDTGLGQQAQDQGMVDAENNSIDGGYFSGFDPGVGVSSGDAGMGGFGDSVGSEGE